jgi:hypothetical protein
MSDDFQPESDISQKTAESYSERWGLHQAVFRIRIKKFLGLPDPLVRGTDPDLDPSVIKQK